MHTNVLSEILNSSELILWRPTRSADPKINVQVHEEENE